MRERTVITIDDLVLLPVHCDWLAGRFACLLWTRTPSAQSTTLRRIVQATQLKTCHLRPSPLDSRLTIPVSFAAYVAEWRSREVSPGLLQHEVTLAMSGPPWRDDDTPIESHDELWALMGHPCAPGKD